MSEPSPLADRVKEEVRSISMEINFALLHDGFIDIGIVRYYCLQLHHPHIIFGVVATVSLYRQMIVIVNIVTTNNLRDMFLLPHSTLALEKINGGNALHTLCTHQILYSTSFFHAKKRYKSNTQTHWNVKL